MHKIFLFYANLILATLVATQVNGQMASYGNLYVHDDVEVGVHSTDVLFTDNAMGDYPGMILTDHGEENTGFFSFVGTTDWTDAVDAKHVDGYVKTYNTEETIFPIGHFGALRPAAVSTAGPGADAINAAYYGYSGSFGGYDTASKESAISTVSPTEYWDINGTTPAKITLTWNTASNVSAMLGLEDLDKLKILGWDGMQWVVVPSTIDTLNKVDGTVSSTSTGSLTTDEAFAPSNYSVYTLGVSTEVLAVDFLDINATLVDDFVKVNWATSHEDDAVYYIVERSTDGVLFDSIATVDAIGSHDRQDYIYNDHALDTITSSIVYYRITEVAIDGTTMTSSIAAVFFTLNDSTWELATIAQGSVFTLSNDQTKTKTVIGIYDAAGRQLRTGIHKNTNTIDINLRGLARGIYFLDVNNGEQTFKLLRDF